MKNLVGILLFLVAAHTASAQNTTVRVLAGDIIRQINEGRPVEYTNVEIEGDLDLTDLENRRLERSAYSLFDFGGNDTYESTVEVSLRFTNCTFLGDVLAYYHIERKQDTYLAHFEREVVFKNCIFKRASEFKYSEFNADASFEGCTFNETANFKYAEFSKGPVFRSALFDGGADFKYTEFPRETSFEKATFHGLANFKYAKFRSPLNLTATSFRGREDFKYTKVDGQDFTSYLLER